MNRALLVGINRYPNAPLQGCVNDVVDMGHVLVQRCGFADSDIRLLVDDRATTQGIKDRLAWLIGGAKAGDRLLFHYSGHGSQMAPRDEKGTITSLHDVICPVDFDFTAQHALSDVDFARIFGAISAGVEFNWVSDSCHSGDLARAILSDRGRVKNYPVPEDMQWRISTARDEKKLEAPGFARAIEHLKGALIAGCRSDQTSADAVFNNRPNGALTYFLLKTLSLQGGLTRPLTQVVALTAKALHVNGYGQDPTLRGQPKILETPFLGPTKKSEKSEGETAPPEFEAGVRSLSFNFDTATLSQVFELLGKVVEGGPQTEKQRDGSVSISGSVGPGGPTVSGTVTVNFNR